MKLLRVLGTMTLLVLALFVAPSTATAAPYGGSSGGVTVSPNGNGTTTVTVTGGRGDTSATVTVTGPGGTHSQTKALGSDRKASFTFNTCGNGVYHFTARDQDGNVLGRSSVRGSGTCTQGGPRSSSGGLPSTGSSNTTTIGLIAGGALLVGGAGFVLASRKRQVI